MGKASLSVKQPARLPPWTEVSVSVSGLFDQEVSSETDADENIIKLAVGKDFTITPSFIDESESGTYYYEIQNGGDRFSASDLEGFEFDSESGVISGSPEFFADTNLSLNAYHVESGEWISVGFTIFAATSFSDEDLKIYYRSDSNQDSYFVISVDDASSFTTCPMDSGEKCLTTDNDIELYLEYIDETSNLLYVSIENTYEFPEHETLEDSKTIDNADSFVSSDANISSVVRVF